MKLFGIRQAASSGYLKMIMAVLIGSVPLAALAQETKPAPKPAAKPAPARRRQPRRPVEVALQPLQRRAGARARTQQVRAGANPTTTSAGRGTTATSPGPGRNRLAVAAVSHPAARGAETHPGDRPGVRGEITRPGGARPGESVSRGAHGEEIRRGPHGDVRDVHAHGMDIHHGPGGERTIVRERADHSRLVSDRFGHGYIERPYAYRGATFVNRTYYVGGVALRPRVPALCVGRGLHECVCARLLLCAGVLWLGV